MLLISLLVVAAAFSLRVHGDERVGLAAISELVLPPLCLSRAWFGVSCPGCGLTRSFIFLAQGDWDSAWAAHRLGWLLAVLVLLQIPYRVHGLCRPTRALIPSRARHWISMTLIGALIGNWLIGVFS
jgi:hypothetical protein